MSRALPPLNPLRVFDAAARLGSLSRAADALGVTHSAVSRQIAALEAHLGQPLFARGPRGVALTKAAARYHKEIGPAFAAIAAATARFTGAGGGEPLRLSVYTTFASKWLMHRLPRFEARFPGIAVEIITTVAPVDFGGGGIDVAIQFGDGVWPGIASEALFEDVIEPVCSPALLRQGPPLAAIGDLAGHRLLQSRYRKRDWYDWLRGVERADLIPLVERRTGGFQNSLLAYQAATEGLGIAMGQVRLLETDLAAGRLVRPFARPVSRRLGYYLVLPEGQPRSRRLDAFRTWLRAEAVAVRAQLT